MALLNLMLFFCNVKIYLRRYKLRPFVNVLKLFNKDVIQYTKLKQYMLINE